MCLAEWLISGSIVADCDGGAGGQEWCDWTTRPTRLLHRIAGPAAAVGDGAIPVA